MKLSRARRHADNLRSALELVLLPALVALLPWALGYRLARALGRCRWLYRGTVDATTAAAVDFGFAPDPVAFARANRALRLIDHADLYRSRWRRRPLRADRLERHGAWPARSGPLLAITFHWGAGLFAIRDLAATGHRLACLSTRFDASHVDGMSVPLRYGLARLAEVERVAGARLIYQGDGARAFLRALERGESLLSLMDVPPDEVGGAMPVRLLGRPARLPAGLVKLAAHVDLPVVLFAMDVDLASGRRRLYVSPPFRVVDRGAAMQQAADTLDALIRRHPAAWHFWAQAPGFFTGPPDGADSSAGVVAADVASGDSSRPGPAP